MPGAARIFSMTVFRRPAVTLQRAEAPSFLTGVDQIASAIHVVRDQRVMLDVDLAALYGVTTKQLNQQVKRNRQRFPTDFAFQLTLEEWAGLRSQSVTSNAGRGGRRFLPFAFTEHGAVMLASVLNSPIAVEASIQVVRAFVQLRGMLTAHAELARKLDELERNYDAQFKTVFDAIRELMRPPPPEHKQIGFRSRTAADARARRSQLPRGGSRPP